MAYTSNVPVSGQSLGNSRPIINANFGFIGTTLAKDHFDTGNANCGLHQQVTQPSQGTGSPGGIAGTGRLFSGLNSNGLGDIHQFYQYPSGTRIQITNDQSSTTDINQSVIPAMGGQIMQFGTGTTRTGGGNPEITTLKVPFQVNGSGTTNYLVIITPYTNPATTLNWYVQYLSSQTFKVSKNGTTDFDYAYIAIGPFN